MKQLGQVHMHQLDGSAKKAPDRRGVYDLIFFFCVFRIEVCARAREKKREKGKNGIKK